jgi:hypothetical protein
MVTFRNDYGCGDRAVRITYVDVEETAYKLKQEQKYLKF